MNKAPDSLPPVPRGKASTSQALMQWLYDLDRRGELSKDQTPAKFKPTPGQNA